MIKLKNKVFSIGIVGVIVLLSASWLFAKNNDDIYKKLEVLGNAISIVRTDYVEDKSAQDLIYGALKGMLASLDTHSQFMSPEDYREIMVETEGKFGGLGIEITIKDRFLTIITPLDDTPAFKAGIKAGDRIVKIDGEITKDITLDGAVSKLRGKVGSNVTLTVLREKDEGDQVLDITIERGIIKIDSIKEAEILEDNIGYIKLVEFQENTTEDFDKALNNLTKQGMRALILDLRNNPGGVLEAAVGVCSRFIKQNDMIVYTKGRIPSQNLEFKSSADNFQPDYPMVVLINRGSASGSEIVAGALQDYKRAVIIGTTSFGKGTVQTVIPLKDGSALRLTTSKYFTPKARMINKKGIEPDVTVAYIPVKEEKIDKNKEKQDEIFKKIAENDKGKDKKVKQAVKKEEKKKSYDSQLAYAINVIKSISRYEQYRKNNLKLKTKK